jgi:hypothetical protein
MSFTPLFANRGSLERDPMPSHARWRCRSPTTFVPASPTAQATRSPSCCAAGSSASCLHRLAKWQAWRQRNCGMGLKQHAYGNVGCISRRSKRRDWGHTIRPRLSIFSHVAERHRGCTLATRLHVPIPQFALCPHLDVITASDRHPGRDAATTRLPCGHLSKLGTTRRPIFRCGEGKAARVSISFM